MNDITAAADYLKRAIALHQRHMDGTEPTTGPEGERSQMAMMRMMQNALKALSPDNQSLAKALKRSNT